MHHMTLKKYLRMLEAKGHLDVLENGELYPELIKLGLYNAYAYSFESGEVLYRFYHTKPEWAK